MKALNEFLKESVKYSVVAQTDLPKDRFLSFANDLKRVVKADVIVNTTSQYVIHTNGNTYYGVGVEINDDKTTHTFMLLQDAQDVEAMYDNAKDDEETEAEFTHILVEPYENSAIRINPKIYKIVGKFDNLSMFAREFGRMYNDVIDYQHSNNYKYLVAFHDVALKYKRVIEITNEKVTRIE